MPIAMVLQQGRSASLPRLSGPSSTHRSLSTAAKGRPWAASSTAAGALASGVSRSSSSIATSASTASVTHGSKSRQSKHRKLPALLTNSSKHLPHLALEGSKSERPPMRLHNVGLIRRIFEEARSIHLARGEYQARASDSKQQDGMRSVIFREVCTDIMAATRKCCNAYRAVEALTDLAAIKAESKRQEEESRKRKAAEEEFKARSKKRAEGLFQKFRPKLFVEGTLNKMLREEQENKIKAEQMWKQCCVGLSLSMSVCAANFASKSIGLGSMQPTNLPCGSISLGLRKFRKTSPKADMGGRSVPLCRKVVEEMPMDV